MYTATIEVKKYSTALQKVLREEIHTFDHQRATLELKQTPDALSILIKGSDAVAFRVGLNTIARTLTIHDKARKVVHD